jgi:RNA polymerase sigma-70 factor, ECF subfamily
MSDPTSAAGTSPGTAQERVDALTTRPSIFVRLNGTNEGPREIAWSDFRKRYAPIIAGFARNLGARPQEIDDVIQDVLMGFFAKSPTFVYDPAKGRFRGYLKVCTYRALRKRSSVAALKFKAMPLDQVDPDSLEFDQAWNDVWEQEQLRRALDETREHYRHANTFRAFEQYVILGKPADQVAELLGMHVNSVYRAKEQITEVLRQKMQARQNEEG